MAQVGAVDALASVNEAAPVQPLPTDQGGLLAYAHGHPSAFLVGAALVVLVLVGLLRKGRPPKAVQTVLALALLGLGGLDPSLGTQAQSPSPAPIAGLVIDVDGSATVSVDDLHLTSANGATAGTLVMGTDPALGYPLVQASQKWGGIGYYDVDGSGTEGPGDPAYALKASGHLSVGDLRLTPFGGNGAATLVKQSDTDVNNPTSPSRLNALAFVDNDGNGKFGRGESLYLTASNAPNVRVGDLRLSGPNAFQRVTASSADLGAVAARTGMPAFGVVWTIGAPSGLSSAKPQQGAAFGSQVKSGDTDPGLALASTSLGFFFVDRDGDGKFGRDDFGLVAPAGATVVSVGQFWISGGTGVPAGTAVAPSSPSLGSALTAFNRAIAYVDRDASGAYSVADGVYLVERGSPPTLVAALRLSDSSTFAAGTFVQPGDSDRVAYVPTSLAAYGPKQYDANQDGKLGAGDAVYLTSSGSAQILDVRLWTVATSVSPAPTPTPTAFTPAPTTPRPSPSASPTPSPSPSPTPTSSPKPSPTFSGHPPSVSPGPSYQWNGTLSDARALVHVGPIGVSPPNPSPGDGMLFFVPVRNDGPAAATLVVAIVHDGIELDRVVITDLAAGADVEVQSGVWTATSGFHSMATEVPASAANVDVDLIGLAAVPLVVPPVGPVAVQKPGTPPGLAILTACLEPGADGPLLRLDIRNMPGGLAAPAQMEVHATGLAQSFIAQVPALEDQAVVTVDVPLSVDTQHGSRFSLVLSRPQDGLAHPPLGSWLAWQPEGSR